MTTLSTPIRALVSCLIWAIDRPGDRRVLPWSRSGRGLFEGGAGVPWIVWVLNHCCCWCCWR